VRKAILIATLFVTAGCARQPLNSAPSSASGTRAAASGNLVGASTSRAAVDGFLAAVKQADLQGMSALWGNEKGLARDKFKRDELEKRLVVMQCLLQHDRWSYVEDAPRLQTAGRQAWGVSLTRKKATARTTLTTVPGPNGRWFLMDADLTPLRDFCA